MKSYKISLKLESSFGTPFHSDTIWGHICWALRYLYGENKLKEFLNGYSLTDIPLLVSDGFIDDSFPLPKLKPVSLKDLYNGKIPNNKLVNFIKILNKNRFINLKTLNLYRKNFSLKLIYEKVLNLELCPNEFREIPAECKIKSIDECPFFGRMDKTVKCPLTKPVRTVEIAHNTISRLTNTSLEEGGLYFFEENFISQSSQINIFVYSDYLEEKEIKSIFEFILTVGYGRDISTGKGKGKIIVIEEYDLNKDFISEYFVTLSHFIPSENDRIEGFYSIITKYPKLGSYYSNQPFDGINSTIPWKKPLLMFTPGSTFKIYSNQKYFGKLLRDVHFSKKIMHYAYVFPLYIKPADGEFI